jgi:CBF1 interacting corepressor
VGGIKRRIEEMRLDRGVSGRVICFSRVAPLEMSSKMKFLFTKSFHPGNAENVKQVYLAEEKAKSRAKLDELNVRERQKEIEKEQMLKLLGKAGDKDAARAAAMAPVSFLYAPPPGLNEPGKAPPPPGMTREEAHLVAAISGDIPPEDIEGIPAAPKRLSMIEKFPNLLTRLLLLAASASWRHSKHVAPFPQCIFVTSTQVQPFGLQLRNVRCLRCKQWGHNSGDRECPLRDAPGRMDEVVRSAEDPITAMRGSKGGTTLAGGFQLLVDEDCVRGGYAVGSKNQQLLDFNLDDLTEEELRRIAGDESHGAPKHSKSHHRSHKHHHHSRHDSNGGRERSKEGPRDRSRERDKERPRVDDSSHDRGSGNRDHESRGRDGGGSGDHRDGKSRHRHRDGSRERRPRSRSRDRAHRQQ